MGILIALFGRNGQPPDGGFRILGNAFFLQIELSKLILSILIALFGRSGQPPNGGLCILWNAFFLQV